MKKIIVIEQENKYQYDSIEELVKDILDEKYYNFSQEQKKEILKKKANLNIINKKDVTIQDNFTIENNSIENKIITTNEYTYILSLANLDIITILEQKDADIFLKGWDKEKFEGNYIIINRFAKELITKYA